MKTAYNALKSELHSELLELLTYWKENNLDFKFGGFLGCINHFNKIIPEANKGIILNTRILWSFSAASNYLKTKEYQPVCDRAFNYLKAYFNDSKFGGVYWELDYLGNTINKRKQVYAQAFAIYALSEYYLLSKNIEAKRWAIELFELIELHSKDVKKDGYIEAFNEDWSPIEDMRLSDKDMNASKTMNTHLHILEAYTSLFRVYPNESLKYSLSQLIELFLQKFYSNSQHFHLFFDTNWNLLSNEISYGHDIETVWLLIEACKMVGNKKLLTSVEAITIQVADVFLNEAIDAENGVLNEKNSKTGVVDSDRHWWPQFEALIGLKYAYQIYPKKEYLINAIQIWNFTKKHLKDVENGEWFYRVNAQGVVYTQEDKVSMWKAPYHISRAFILMNS